MTYEPYSNDPHYIEGNRAFVRSLDLQSAQHVLDLACGVGTLTDLMWETWPDLNVVGVDLSSETLVIARDRPDQVGSSSAPADSDHTALRADRRVRRLAAGNAHAIPLRASSFHAVVMGHSIHLMEDEDRLLREVHRVLRPGGLFAFNTSFYAGTFVPGTEPIYHNWVKEALSYIQTKDRELRRQGRTGIRRVRGSVPPAFSKGWPSAEEWIQRLGKHGFHAAQALTTTVTLTQYSFETIGAYAGFARVILSGYPVDVASEALQAAAGPTLRTAGVEEVPRYWLEVRANRA